VGGRKNEGRRGGGGERDRIGRMGKEDRKMEWAKTRGRQGRVMEATRWTSRADEDS
jgi:hypothetical protein